MPTSDSEWRLKKAIELLMGDSAIAIQKLTKDNLRKRITND